MAVRNVQIVVTAPPPAGGPDWWRGVNAYPAFPANTWRIVAGAANQRIRNVLAPVAPVGRGQNGPTAICTAWTGGTVDQANRQLIFAANGGDGDWAGNEVYGLSLGEQEPSWRRIGEPTPNALIPIENSRPYMNLVAGVVPSEPTVFPASLQMKSDHTCWDAHFYNGKVWFAMQNSTYPGPGGGVGIFSWDKAAAAGSAPASAAWRYWGSHATGQTTYIFTAAALDPTTGKIWRINKYYNAAGFAVSCDANNTAGGEGRTERYNWSGKYSPQFIHESGAAVVADPIRTLFTFDANHVSGNQMICWLDLTNPTTQWVGPVVTTGATSWGPYSGKFPPNGNAFYHNGYLYLGAPHSCGGLIRRMQVPILNGKPNPAGPWVWETVHTGVATGPNDTPPTTTSSAGSYSKFNIVRDMGNGQAALVVCDSIDGATYVYKLP